MREEKVWRLPTLDSFDLVSAVVNQTDVTGKVDRTDPFLLSGLSHRIYKFK